MQENAKFLEKAGTGCLEDWRDLKVDKRMENSKTKSFYFTINDKNLDTASEDNYDYKVIRFVYIHNVNRNFHKVLILLTHREERSSLYSILFQWKRT